MRRSGNGTGLARSASFGVGAAMADTSQECGGWGRCGQPDEEPTRKAFGGNAGRERGSHRLRRQRVCVMRVSFDEVVHAGAASWVRLGDLLPARRLRAALEAEGRLASPLACSTRELTGQAAYLWDLLGLRTLRRAWWWSPEWGRW